jgi:hypothetical protein
MAKVEKSIEIQALVHTVYEQLLRFENYPRYIERIGIAIVQTKGLSNLAEQLGRWA